MLSLYRFEGTKKKRRKLERIIYYSPRTIHLNLDSDECIVLNGDFLNYSGLLRHLASRFLQFDNGKDAAASQRHLFFACALFGKQLHLDSKESKGFCNCIVAGCNLKVGTSDDRNGT